MSTESRLARLGLLHLQNDPEALQRELERRSALYQAEVDAWHATREQRLAALEPPGEAAPPAVPVVIPDGK